MVFDNHHHVIREKLASHEHASVAKFVRAARSTWPQPSWQTVHLSNGLSGLHDRNHSEFIDVLPSAYRTVRWIEVVSTGKECDRGLVQLINNNTRRGRRVSVVWFGCVDRQAFAVVMRRTRVAFEPLGPSSASYSTVSPSWRVLNP
jgi:UV DNA damage repair endonuclease